MRTLITALLFSAMLAAQAQSPPLLSDPEVRKTKSLAAGILLGGALAGAVFAKTNPDTPLMAIGFSGACSLIGLNLAINAETRRKRALKPL